MEFKWFAIALTVWMVVLFGGISKEQIEKQKTIQVCYETQTKTSVDLKCGGTK